MTVIDNSGLKNSNYKIFQIYIYKYLSWTVKRVAKSNYSTADWEIKSDKSAETKKPNISYEESRRPKEDHRFGQHAQRQLEFLKYRFL